MAQVLAKILWFVKCSLFARTEGKTISLHDVDKGNDDRGNPSPNTHDVVVEGANRAHRTVSTSYSTATGAPGARIQMGNNQVNAYDANNLLVSTYGIQADGSINLKFFDTAGVGTAQFGRYADGTTKLKIAKDGIEVSTAGADQLIFNSGQDILKVTETGSVNLNTGTVGTGAQTSYSATGSFTGTYASVPIVIALITVNGGSTLGQFVGGGGSGAGVLIPTAYTVSSTAVTITQAIRQRMLVTTTNVQFTLDCMNTSGSFTFQNYIIKYYVLQESAT